MSSDDKVVPLRGAPTEPPIDDEIQRAAWDEFKQASLQHEQAPSVSTAMRKAASYAAWINLFLDRERSQPGPRAA